MRAEILGLASIWESGRWNRGGGDLVEFVNTRSVWGKVWWRDDMVVDGDARA